MFKSLTNVTCPSCNDSSTSPEAFCYINAGKNDSKATIIAIIYCPECDYSVSVELQPADEEFAKNNMDKFISQTSDLFVEIMAKKTDEQH